MGLVVVQDQVYVEPLLRPGTVLTLSVEGDEVRMSGWLLIPTSEHTFFSPQDYGEITVVMHEDGSVERLDWMVAGDNHPMPRVTDPEGSPSLLIGAEP